MGNGKGFAVGEAFIGAQRRSFKRATLATVKGGITASVERKVKSKEREEGWVRKEKRAEFEERERKAKAWATSRRDDRITSGNDRGHRSTVKHGRRTLKERPQFEVSPGKSAEQNRIIRRPQFEDLLSLKLSFPQFGEGGVFEEEEVGEARWCGLGQKKCRGSVESRLSLSSKEDNNVKTQTDIGGGIGIPGPAEDEHHRHSATVVVVVTRHVVVYMLWGGELEDGGDRKVTYLGGSRKCIVLKEGAGIEEVRRMVTEISGNELSEQKVWFSLKYDRGLVMALEGDADVRMFFKGNDEHEYFYADTPTQWMGIKSWVGCSLGTYNSFA
ncbi:hypothetical protein Cgig2_000477 [Carnegiea gigantea]|uniref:Uncharacterized protein n=1 Tax=Carnegiea gigantea TaxID=171969 RepID=A0A9Q1K4H9_9CARY|nr:hypothetical protein Cgig2_000477 [Carnegiea gigantea]